MKRKESPPTTVTEAAKPVSFVDAAATLFENYVLLFQADAKYRDFDDAALRAQLAEAAESARQCSIAFSALSEDNPVSPGVRAGVKYKTSGAVLSSSIHKSTPQAITFDRIRSSPTRIEFLVGLSVAIGLLDDAVAAQVTKLPARQRNRAAEAIANWKTPQLELELRELIQRDKVQADRLALWARSLVGDALLCVRELGESDWSPLVSNHTRRMDSLGLTA